VRKRKYGDAEGTEGTEKKDSEESRKGGRQERCGATNRDPVFDASCLPFFLPSSDSPMAGS
jgi:hypothetical protein